MENRNKKLFVVVAGNIGSGKTTLTEMLSKKLDWRANFESVEDNPYLDDFYQDMDRWSFPLQVYFLNHRFHTHQVIERSNFSAIQDRSIYEDAHIFARALHEQGIMPSREYKNYRTLYETMLQFLGAPDLVIFLKRSVPKLMERIALRNRDCEKSISPEYISNLNRYYDEWFEGYDLGKSLLVDTDELDFVERPEHFDALVKKIFNVFEEQDMFFNFDHEEIPLL